MGSDATRRATIDALKGRITALEAGSASYVDGTYRENGDIEGRPCSQSDCRSNVGQRRILEADRIPEIHNVPKNSRSEDALKKIAALVNVSDRSERTIRERLERYGFAPDDIDISVERAKALGFIDDMRFASVLVRSRLAQGKGIPGITRELSSHGICIDEVPGWSEDFEVDEDSEINRAVGVLERRPPKSKNLREGAYRKLISKGFSSGVSSAAARIWFDKLQLP